MKNYWFDWEEHDYLSYFEGMKRKKKQIRRKEREQRKMEKKNQILLLKI